MSERQPALHYTAQIIQFAAVRPKLGKRTFQRSEPVVRAPLNEEGLTDTCQNQRIRQARYEDWRKADAVREYWRAKLKMDGAI